MNKNEAIEKIDFIKETIEDTKVRYRGMYQMCFLLGGMYLLQFAVGILHIVLYQLPFAVYFVFYYIVEIAVLFCYLFIYKEEKMCSNKYYLSILGIWGFISIVIPIIVSVVDCIGSIFFAESYGMFSIPVAQMCLEFSRVLLFSVFLIICSYILNHYFFRVLSVLILSGYLFCYECLFNKGVPFPVVPGQEQMGIGYITVYTVLTVDIGYLIMGFYLKHKEEKYKGNEHK